MIPGVLVDFLARASVAVASTRDHALVPHLHWVSGWWVEEDGETVVCLVSASFTDHLLDSLEANRQFAVMAEWIGPHECYQYKGSYLDSRPATASDRLVYETCRERFVAAVRAHLGDRFSERALRHHIREPAIAVRFKVDEVFLQTPGPGAGRRLFPRES